MNELEAKMAEDLRDAMQTAGLETWERDVMVEQVTRALILKGWRVPVGAPLRSPERAVKRS